MHIYLIIFIIHYNFLYKYNINNIIFESSDFLSNFRVVFIILGGNSITRDTTPNEIFDDLKQAVEELKMCGTERVYVSGIVTRGKFRAHEMDKVIFDKMRKSVNEKLKKYLKNDYIDLGRVIKYPTHYDKDKVHPSHSGLMKLRSTILCAFRKA